MNTALLFPIILDLYQENVALKVQKVNKIKLTVNVVYYILLFIFFLAKEL